MKHSSICLTAAKVSVAARCVASFPVLLAVMSCFLNSLVARSMMFLARVQLLSEILLLLGVVVFCFMGVET